jgi:hypothetical protein
VVQAVVVAALKVEIPQVVLEQAHLVKGLTAALVYHKTQIDQAAVAVALAVRELRVLGLMVEMVVLLQHHLFQAHQ